MHKLLNPQSIAIIGASNTEGKVGNILAHNLLDHNYGGAIYFVNPKGGEILGQRVHTSLHEVGQEVDVAVIAIPADYVISAITSAKDFCKNFVVISAGFGEAGIDGHNKEIALAALAEREGLTILGPNCLGFVTPALKLNASFSPGMPESGPLAFISQSGALAVALVDRAQEFHIGFSSVVSIGNKMDVDAAQLIQHFVDDDQTTVIALYLESIKDGPGFLAAAMKARQAGKHVILLKSGRTQEAQNAIALHTGSLAGDDAVIDLVCTKAGVTRVNSIAELFNVVRVAMTTPLEKHLSRSSARIAIITNAGGPGVVATDAVSRAQHISMETLTDVEEDKLKAVLPPAASVHNPIDLLGDAGIDRYQAALDLCMASEHLDIVFVLLTPQSQTPVEEVAGLVIDAHSAGAKTVVAAFIGGESIVKAREMMRQAGVLAFEVPDDAVRALDMLSHRGTDDFAQMTSTPAPMGVSEIFATMIDETRTATYYEEASQIMNLYHVPVQDFWDVTQGLGTQTHVTYPCVAKVDNPQVLHKSDRGGVILPIGSGAELENAREKLLRKFPETGTRIIAQPMAEIDVEMIIGMKRDQTFGPVVVVGIGGIYTEIFQKTELFLEPLSQSDIIETLETGSLAFLFAGARGQVPYSAKQIAHTVRALFALSADFPDVQAIDINPLLIYNDSRDVLAIDIKIVRDGTTVKSKQH